MLLLASCQKDEAPAPLNDNNIVQATTKTGTNGRVLHCTGCDQDGINCKDCDCSGSGGNCLPDVVISGLHSASMDSVFTAIATKDKPTIKAAFLTNKGVLSNYLAMTDINNVINGAAFAGSAAGPSGSRFILIQNPQGKRTAAYPLY